MFLRLPVVCLILVSLSTIASTPNVISIYHDADYGVNNLSAEAMKMGLLTAFDEVDNQIQGYRLQLVEKNHRGNIKRSFLNMKAFVKDDSALFMLGGLHSPPYIKHRTFINENNIPLLVPWAAGGPITRFPSANNWVFRLSIDDTKAGIRISEFAVNKLECKNPHLLLEDTAWGKSNQKTMSAYLTDKVPYGLGFFNWNIKENAARMMLRSVISAGHDCVFLVANISETQQFAMAMASLEPQNRVPFVSHWGATGGDIDKIFTKEVKQAISFHFIQSCYSFAAPQQSAFNRAVITRAKKLFPKVFHDPKTLRAPAGFIHAYDIGRLAIAALQQTQLTNDMQQNRLLFKQALESLNQPIQGLIKEYKQPYSTWSQNNPDAHEALSLENFCMASFGEHNQIEIADN